MLRYLNIKREFFEGMSTKEIQKIIKERTGKNLKQILFELYTVKGESVEDISELFACSHTTIRSKIKEYGLAKSDLQKDLKIIKSSEKKSYKVEEVMKNNATNNEKEKVDLEKVNGEKFNRDIQRVYYKTPKIIESETGRSFVEIVQEYISKGYSSSQIAKELKLANQTNIKQALKKLEYSKQDIMYPNIFGRGKSLRKNEEMFFELTGISLIEFLKKKYVEEGLSTHAIAPLFGTDSGTIHSKLKAYGLNRNLSEARRLLIEKGDINYGEIHAKRTITVQKENNESKNQKLAGELFHIHFAELISEIQNIEVIIGFNNWFILSDKEVDIPIIIIDEKKKRIYKYAIEYQAEHTHSSNERIKADKEKEKRLKLNEWVYFTIWDSPYYHVIESRVIEIIKLIISQIK